MTEVYSSELNQVVANGDEYRKVSNHYEVANCLPLNGPQVGGRYILRHTGRPQISVKCTQQGAAGIQTAHFTEV